MVCFHLGQTLPLSPLDSPRDWSHQWDQQQPPLKGEACFVVMLIGVRRKAKWLPRTLDSMPPVAFWLGAGVFTWTRSRQAAVADVAAFNRLQVRKAVDGKASRLWAAVGWGICGHESTVRVLERGQL